MPGSDTFIAQITGTHITPGGDETAAFFNTGADGDEFAVKTAWLDQVFSPETAARLPGLRMVVWFEQAKPEPEIDGAIVDWRVSHRPDLADRFRERVEAWMHATP